MFKFLTLAIFLTATGVAEAAWYRCYFYNCKAGLNEARPDTCASEDLELYKSLQTSVKAGTEEEKTEQFFIYMLKNGNLKQRDDGRFDVADKSPRLFKDIKYITTQDHICQDAWKDAPGTTEIKNSRSTLVATSDCQKIARLAKGESAPITSIKYSFDYMPQLEIAITPQSGGITFVRVATPTLNFAHNGQKADLQSIFSAANAAESTIEIDCHKGGNYISDIRIKQN